MNRNLWVCHQLRKCQLFSRSLWAGCISNMKTWSFVSTAVDLTWLSSNAKIENNDMRKTKLGSPRTYICNDQGLNLVWNSSFLKCFFSSCLAHTTGIPNPQSNIQYMRRYFLISTRSWRGKASHNSLKGAEHRSHKATAELCSAWVLLIVRAELSELLQPQCMLPTTEFFCPSQAIHSLRR